MVGVIVMETFQMCDFSTNFKEIDWLDLQSGWGIFTSWSILLYAFCCHPNVLDVYRELKDRNKKRMSKVLGSVVFVANNFYLIVGFFGYVTFINDYS